MVLGIDLVGLGAYTQVPDETMAPLGIYNIGLNPMPATEFPKMIQIDPDCLKNDI